MKIATETPRPVRPSRSGLRQRRGMGAFLVLSGALCLSISAILVKLAHADAATTAVARCALAVVVLIPLALAEMHTRAPLSRVGCWWASVAGVALGVDYAAWTASIYDVGAGISTVLINVQVIILPLLALIFDRERPRARFLFCLPLMVLGLTLVGGLWDTSAHSSTSVRGLIWGLVAGTGYGVYLFITRRSASKDPGLFLQPLAIATASAALAALALSPLSGGVHFTNISARSWLLLITLAVVGQVIAWLFIHHGMTRVSSVAAGGLLLIQPVLALALSTAILHEAPTWRQLLGAAVVITAVAVANGLVRFKPVRQQIQPARQQNG